MIAPRAFPLIPQEWEDVFWDFYCNLLAAAPKCARRFSLLTEWRRSLTEPPPGDWREFLPAAISREISRHWNEYIVVRGDSVFCSLDDQIHLDEFPSLYRSFLWRKMNDTGRDTLKLEARGAALMKSARPCERAAARFAADVVQWEDDGRKDTPNWPNAEAGLIRAFPRVAESLRRGDIAAAYDAVWRTKGARHRYGTKMLQMLAPGRAVGYDSVFASALPYWFRRGYVALCEDCGAVAVALNQRGIRNESRKNGEWHAADAGSVLYNHFYWKRWGQKR